MSRTPFSLDILADLNPPAYQTARHASCVQQELFLEYLADEPPHLLARSEAAAFVDWLRPRLGAGPAAEVLRLEPAAFDVMLDGTAAELWLRIDPWEVRTEIMAGRLPELADDERFVVCLTA